MILYKLINLVLKQDKLRLFFWSIQLLIGLIFVFIIIMILIGNVQYSQDWHDLGEVFGASAAIFLILVSLPGVLIRLFPNLRSNKGIIYLLKYRRELGKLMFVLVLIHFTLMKFLPVFNKLVPISYLPVYQTFGLLSFIFSLILFLTSNNLAVKLLKRYWIYIHKLVYIIIWLVFLHIFFIEPLSILSIIMFIFSIMQTISLIKFYFLDKSNKDV